MKFELPLTYYEGHGFSAHLVIPDEVQIGQLFAHKGSDGSLRVYRRRSPNRGVPFMAPWDPHELVGRLSSCPDSI